MPETTADIQMASGLRNPEAGGPFRVVRQRRLRRPTVTFGSYEKRSTRSVAASTRPSSRATRNCPRTDGEANGRGPLLGLLPLKRRAC